MAIRVLHPERDHRILFLNWHHNIRRSETIASELGCPVAYVYSSSASVPGPVRLPVRYARQALTTWRLLEERRPRLVLVTNPPVVAPLIVWAWSALRGAHWVLDNHSGTFLDPHWRWALPIQRWLARRALRSVVLNNDELRMSEDPNASVVLVPDGVPHFEQAKVGRSPGDPFTVVVVCGEWRNEPVTESLEACALLPEVRFLLTGDADQLPESVRAPATANVEFTGYLRGEEYAECLRSSDAGMVLSLRNDLSAGAFECLGMGLPMILSDWPNPREHFEEAAVFVDCDAAAIAEGVSRVRNSYPGMRRNVESVRRRRTEDWQRHFGPVRTAIEQKARGVP